MSGRWISTVVAIVLAAGAGWWARERFAPATRAGVGSSQAEGPCPGGAQPLYWKAPMDPTYIRDEPGKSPMGMDLVPECPAGEPAMGTGPCPGGAEPLYWKAPMDPTYIRDEPGKSPMGMDLVPECPTAGAAPAEGVIRVDPAIVQSIGVRTAEVARRDLARVVRAVGRVDYDERLVAHVHTKVQGWIEKLHVEYEGQMVRRGQPLLEIYSPELVSTQEELLIASRYRKETEKSPFPDVSEGGESLLEATRRRLELWDIPKRDIDRLLTTGEIRKTLTLYSPTSGVVTKLAARQGMEVGANENLYTIADLSQVWVYADVYEYELPWIAEGQRAIVELSYLPGVTFEGKVTYVYPFLDPKTRTARIRIELPNVDTTLKPDMFAHVRIETTVHRDALAVPEQAVLRSGTRSLIVVALGGGRFEPREVQLGLDTGEGWLEIRRGLREGEKIVTSGQFLIDSESKLKEAVQKLLTPKESTPPAATEEDPHQGHDIPGMAGEHETSPSEANGK